MDDATLINIIDRERANGIGRDDTTATDRDEATAFYEGEAKGDLAPPEVDGRSTVVSKDLMDAIEWVMPSLMRMFAGSDEVIRFEPQSSGDEQACKDATAYCAWVLHRANPGFTILHDAFKSALITRTGIVKVYPDETWDAREETYRGLDEMSYQALLADQSVEPVTVEVVNDAQAMMLPGATPTMQTTYNVVVRRKTKRIQYKILGVPPEEVTFSKDTREVGNLRFVCHDVEKTRSDLVSLGYSEADIDACFADDAATSNAWQYEAKYTRGGYDGIYMDSDNPADKSQRKVILSEAYLKVDYDDDGVAEYRRVVKAGSVVFENDVSDDHPFALFTPILMPYKLIGMSFYDLLSDIQTIKTAITRQMIDSMVIANNPRVLAVADKVNLDDLLEPRPGGVVRVRDINAVQPLVTQDISASAQNSIAYFNTVRDSRSGVKEYTQGLIGGELSQSQIGSQGVAMLADAAAARIELIARVFAETGIARIYKLILKLISQHQQDATELKINGHWMTMDPRAWKDEYTMTVSVGVGTASQDKKLQRAQLLLQTQQSAAQFGLVQPQNAMEALQTFTEALGFRDVGKFFSMPDPNAPKQPSPAEMQMQVEREKAQMQMQVEQAKQQAQSQEQAQTKQLEVARDARDAQNQMELAQFKAQQDMALARYKAELDAKTSLAIARINAEAKIAAAQASGVKDDPSAIAMEGAIGL